MVAANTHQFLLDTYTSIPHYRLTLLLQGELGFLVLLNYTISQLISFSATPFLPRPSFTMPSSVMHHTPFCPISATFLLCHTHFPQCVLIISLIIHFSRIPSLPHPYWTIFFLSFLFHFCTHPLWPFCHQEKDKKEILQVIKSAYQLSWAPKNKWYNLKWWVPLRKGEFLSQESQVAHQEVEINHVDLKVGLIFDYSILT